MTSVCRSLLMAAVILLLASRAVSERRKNCLWANEGCETNQQCCSDSCFQRHIGTNHRCRKSSLLEMCIEHYHCQSGLECHGKNHTCCSPYWGSCVNDTHCCESPYQKCREVEGFIYKRCVFPLPGAAMDHHPSSLLTLTSTVMVYLGQGHRTGHWLGLAVLWVSTVTTACIILETGVS